MTDFAPAVFLFVVMLAVMGVMRRPKPRTWDESDSLKHIKWKDVDGPLPPVSVYPRTKLSTRLKDDE